MPRFQPSVNVTSFSGQRSEYCSISSASHANSSRTPPRFLSSETNKRMCCSQFGTTIPRLAYFVVLSAVDTFTLPVKFVLQAANSTNPLSFL